MGPRPRPHHPVPELVGRQPPEVADPEVPLPVHLPGQREQAGAGQQGLVEVEECGFHGSATTPAIPRRPSSQPPDAPRRSATRPATMDSAISSADRPRCRCPGGFAPGPAPPRRIPAPGGAATCGPTWRRLPMTPMKRAGERSSAGEDSATPGGVVIGVDRGGVPAEGQRRPGSGPRERPLDAPAASRSSRLSTRVGSNPRSRAHRSEVQGHGRGGEDAAGGGGARRAPGRPRSSPARARTCGCSGCRPGGRPARRPRRRRRTRRTPASRHREPPGPNRSFWPSRHGGLPSTRTAVARTRCSPPARRARAARPPASRPGRSLRVRCPPWPSASGAVDRSARQQVERVAGRRRIACRLSRAPFSLPGRLTMSVEPTRSHHLAGEHREGGGGPAHGSHRLGQPRRLALDHLRVASGVTSRRPEPGPAGRDHQGDPRSASDRRIGDQVASSGTTSLATTSKPAAPAQRPRARPEASSRTPWDTPSLTVTTAALGRAACRGARGPSRGGHPADTIPRPPRTQPERGALSWLAPGVNGARVRRILDGTIEGRAVIDEAQNERTRTDVRRPKGGRWSTRSAGSATTCGSR